MKERVIFEEVCLGQRALRVCLHVRQVPAHRAQVFEPRGGRGLLIAGCNSPGGSRNGMGTCLLYTSDAADDAGQV